MQCVCLIYKKHLCDDGNYVKGLTNIFVGINLNNDSKLSFYSELQFKSPATNLTWIKLL